MVQSALGLVRSLSTLEGEIMIDSLLLIGGVDQSVSGKRKASFKLGRNNSDLLLVGFLDYPNFFGVSLSRFRCRLERQNHIV